jgi:signal transduction histidine kinase
MDPALRTSGSRVAQQRLRFEALRRRVFDELEEGSARWRLTWMLPYQLSVVALLILRGESHARAAAQVLVVGVVATLFVMRIRTNHFLVRKVSFIFGIASYFVLLVTTGGLASPLLIMGAMLLSAAAFTVHDPRWLKGAVFRAFAACVVTLALVWHTGLAQLPFPLADANGIRPEYVALALTSTLFVMVGVYRMGCTMTSGYERAALELAERREELCSAGEDRSRALEGLAARLAHEVKNPLAAIKGLSTHMARAATDPKTAERLAIVAAEADRLQSIVDGFLSFSRGLDDLNVAPMKPREVVHELEVLLETRAEEAGVALMVKGDADLQLDADAPKIRQALLNLVLNAIQASPRGSTVALTVASDCEGAKITVHDDGVGMTPEVVERIRKPYFTTKEGGTGLGVAVARGIVEQHGGRMDIKSASGKGTTITIVLPTKAKPCMKLPNPLRDSAAGNAGEAERAPMPAGVR